MQNSTDIEALVNGAKEVLNGAKCKKKLPRGKGVPFQEGNKLGLRFGEGQSREGNGVRKGSKAIIQDMQAAVETFGLSAHQVAEAMLKIALDENIEPRERFPFLKEINLRIFGQPRNSMEEAMKLLSEKVDHLYELTLPLLEATAIGDGKGLVRELMKQGKLEEVIRQIQAEQK